MFKVLGPVLVVLLAGCAAWDRGEQGVRFEIEVRDPGGVLDGSGAQLTVVTRPYPKSSSARARKFRQGTEGSYLIDERYWGRLDQREGWVLASPDITVPPAEVHEYVFEFQFPRSTRRGGWSDWKAVDFMMVGEGDWDLLYATGRERRVPSSGAAGLEMRHRFVVVPGAPVRGY